MKKITVSTSLDQNVSTGFPIWTDFFVHWDFSKFLVSWNLLKL